MLITTPDGAILGRATRASSAGDQDGAAEAIATTVEAALADAGASVDDVAVIGVGVPGRVDPVTGNVTIAVNLGWTDLALRDALEARLGRPCVIENDARAAAVGLHQRGVLGRRRRHRLSRGRDRDRGRGHPRRPPPPRRAWPGRRDRSCHRGQGGSGLHLRPARLSRGPGFRARRSRAVPPTR